jgi:hypothetical protein
MPLLHVFDASDWRIRWTAGRREESGVTRVPVSNGDPAAALDDVLNSGRAFDRILFETHGSPGKIYFGDSSLGADWWSYARKYNNIAAYNVRVYFNGCNVADTDEGWRFLEAAANVFTAPGGGQVFGQTSLGFGNPFDGHVVHLWGTTRILYLDAGGNITERFEQ